MKHLTKDQNQFIKTCFTFDGTIREITEDFIEIYPEYIELADGKPDEARKVLEDRIQAIKTNAKEEIEEAKNLRGENIMIPAMSSMWRARYFRMLLRNADKIEKIDTKIKLLKELRAEAKLSGVSSEDLDGFGDPDDPEDEKVEDSWLSGSGSDKKNQENPTE